jgi:hypothetical protein
MTTMCGHPSKLVIRSPTLPTRGPATGLTMTTWSRMATENCKQVAGLGEP